MEAAYTLKKPDSHKSKKKVGRGMSSGHGKTCCRGQNGQLCRSGARRRPWFEGGQMPLQRRVPKRGFNNKFRVDYGIVNLDQLAKISEKVITPAMLIEQGFVKKNDRIKILGNGDIDRAITIYADAFAASAKEKIEKAGGKAIIGRPEVEKEQKNNSKKEL